MKKKTFLFLSLAIILINLSSCYIQERHAHGMRHEHHEREHHEHHEDRHNAN